MKNNDDNNQMAPHMRRAVDEMDADIQTLQNDLAELSQARSAIVKLYGGETDVPAVPAAPRITKVKTPTAASTRVEGSGRQPSADSIKLLAVVRTAAEPFTCPALVLASGLDKIKVGKSLSNWNARGLLERAGRGEYKRSATFPATAPTE